MFSGYKYVFAKNRVLMDMEQRGILAGVKAKLMRGISGNVFHRLYGAGMIKKRLAKDKYCAVAAVFARIAAYHQVEPEEGLAYDDWFIAAVHAMMLSTASYNEAEETVVGLIQMNLSLLREDEKR